MSTDRLSRSGQIEPGEFAAVLERAMQSHLYGDMTLTGVGGTADHVITFVNGRVVIRTDDKAPTVAMAREGVARQLTELSDSFDGHYEIVPIIGEAEVHLLPHYHPIALLKQTGKSTPTPTKRVDSGGATADRGSKATVDRGSQTTIPDGAAAGIKPRTTPGVSPAPSSERASDEDPWSEDRSATRSAGSGSDEGRRAGNDGDTATAEPSSAEKSIDGPGDADDARVERSESENAATTEVSDSDRATTSSSTERTDAAATSEESDPGESDPEEPVRRSTDRPKPAIEAMRARPARLERLLEEAPVQNGPEIEGTDVNRGRRKEDIIGGPVFDQRSDDRRHASTVTADKGPAPAEAESSTDGEVTKKSALRRLIRTLVS